MGLINTSVQASIVCIFRSIMEYDALIPVSSGDMAVTKTCLFSGLVIVLNLGALVQMA